MVAATQRPDLQPGMVSVVHTAGDLLGWKEHSRHRFARRMGCRREVGAGALRVEGAPCSSSSRGRAGYHRAPPGSPGLGTAHSQGLRSRSPDLSGMRRRAARCGFSPSCSSLSPSTRSSPTSSARQGLRPAARQRRAPSKFVPLRESYDPVPWGSPARASGEVRAASPEGLLPCRSWTHSAPRSLLSAVSLLSPQLQPSSEAPAEATPHPLARVLPSAAETNSLSLRRRDYRVIQLHLAA